ncbi:hypothetical protein [Halorhabdus sp. BNX81]|uniref:hypothetical protein n=1 Tax=Halorhabdus sp. BNX81 TaxID=2980181 RepID=UPI0023DD4DE4|nr:hypothetical protein [Halorhabdus sp. BNX81]
MSIDVVACDDSVFDNGHFRVVSLPDQLLSTVRMYDDCIDKAVQQLMIQEQQRWGREVVEAFVLCHYDPGPQQDADTQQQREREQISTEGVLHVDDIAPEQIAEQRSIQQRDPASSEMNRLVVPRDDCNVA